MYLDNNYLCRLCLTKSLSACHSEKGEQRVFGKGVWWLHSAPPQSAWPGQRQASSPVPVHLWVFVSRVLGSSYEPGGQAVEVKDGPKKMYSFKICSLYFSAKPASDL